MKKVVLTFAVMAMMVAVSACGNKAAKTAEVSDVLEAVEDCCDSEVTDSTVIANADSTICTEAATEEVSAE